jgi:hypothetical protein
MALTFNRNRNHHRRRGLSSSAREALYDRCRGSDEFPTCNIPGCGRPVKPGERWVESHYPVPHANGGQETGVAHERCNHLFACQIEVPAMAHADRVRRKHIGAHVSRYPLPGGRNSHLKRKVGGGVVPRQARVHKISFAGDPAPAANEIKLDAQLAAVAVEMSLNIAEDAGAFENWLNRIERLLEGRVGTRFGDALLMCDNAMMAFEEGVSADSYALQLQAMRGAV